MRFQVLWQKTVQNKVFWILIATNILFGYLFTYKYFFNIYVIVNP